MKARALWMTIALGLASLSGCSKDEGHDPTPPAPSIAVSASPRSVVANGTNTVLVDVTDTGGGPIHVTSSKGTLSDAGEIAGASGRLTLTTCNTGTDSTCAGTHTITAEGPSGTATTTVTFGSLASLCQTNCGIDAACASHSCNLLAGGEGTCSGSVCTSGGTACTPTPPGATSEASCGDGFDDDCDGDFDCDDSDCAGKACDAGSATSFCKSGACEDLGSGLALTLTPARTRLPATATGSTSVVVEVTVDGKPAAGVDVSLSTAPASLGALSATAGTTGADGKVTVTFTATSTPGVATITASLRLLPTLSQKATITMPRLGGFRLPETPSEFPVLGAKGSAWNEFGWLEVQVLDDTGLPYPDGLAVRFEHRQVGGSTLGEPAVACTTPSGTCVAYDGVTSSGGGALDSAGLARAWLYSGTVAGTLAVTATTTASGLTRTLTLPTVAVVGAKASLANFSIVCNPRNVPALAETDCAVSLVDAPFTCAAILKDRFGNLLGRTTQVAFVSEAGAVGQIATTPEYDPAAEPAGQADLGIATEIFNTLGAGLPFDVDPDSAVSEPSVDHGLDGCGDRTHNPRDGVVTIIAVADGEEAFFDANGNGAYDGAAVGPPAVAAEPFVDQGEPFVDQNDNGSYDPGEWFLDLDGDHAYTLPDGEWTEAAKIWTQTVVVYTGEPVTLFDGTGFLGTRWADDTFVDACTLTDVPAAINLGPGPAPRVPFQTYWTVASDMNLNFLSAATTYAVTPSEDAKLTLEYFGRDAYADGLGFSYRYWPCDQATPQVCASQCRTSGTDGPCLMTPSLSGFSCGATARVDLATGTEPAPIPVFVDWLVSTPWDVFGSSKFSTARLRLSGTSN